MKAGLLNSPLEQFEIAPLSKILGFVMPTNFFLSSFLTCVVLRVIFLSSFKKETSSLYFVPSITQMFFEKVYVGVGGLVSETITHKNEDYFPFIMFLFLFILANNVAGLTVYNFTATSHLMLTFLLAFSIFVGSTLLGYEKHNLNLFSGLLPSNTSFFLAFLLVPIELISYLAKPISLSVRLFVNLMAGHSLLKIIAGFTWKLAMVESVKSTILLVLPLTLLSLLTCLEFAVALIQTYVFVTLTSVYLNDVL